MVSFVMRELTHLLPALDRGRIFRARRVQLGLTLQGLESTSGLSISTLRTVELSASADLSTVRQLAPFLDLTLEQAVAMHAVQHQEYHPAKEQLSRFRTLLPPLNSGYIFRARRAQMGLSRDRLKELSGVGTALIRSLEQMAAVDVDVVHAVAPYLEITPAQGVCMLAVQRHRLFPECLRKLL